MSEQLRLGMIGGTGAEGRSLAVRFALAGVAVTLGSRDAARAVEVAGRLREQHSDAPIDGASNEDVIARCDTLMLTVPFAHAGPVVDALAPVFTRGSLLVDVTVPIVFDAGQPRYVEPPAGSAAEYLRTRLPEHVALACAFKTIPAHVLERTHVALDCDEFVCGDSPESRERVAVVVRSIPGLRPIDAGPLDSARILERMSLLAIRINKRYRRFNGRFRVVGIDHVI